MAQEPVYHTTGVGRYVQGDVFNGSDKDHQGRPRLDQKGQPKTVWYFGLAFPKNDPAFQEIWAVMCQVAQRDFPNGAFNRPDFAWKLIDGDSPNAQGQPRPDYMRGHYVLRLSSGFAPQVFDNSAPEPRQITDPAQCKRGDFVRVQLAIRGNDDQQKPGLYVNPQMVQRCGFGESITVGPSAAEVFAAPPAALPAGASATPVAAGPMPAMPGAPTPAPGVPGHPTQPAPAPTAPAGFNPAAPAVAPGSPTASPTSPPVQPYPQILNGPQGPTQ